MGILERKEREKLQRKNEIIDAAEQVFFTKGFVNSTMEEIASEAELSKGTLYLYFKNKEDLHFAINIKALEILSEMLQEVVHQTKNGYDTIYDMGRCYLDFAKKYPNYFKSIAYFESKKTKIDLNDPDIKHFFEELNPMNYFIEAIRKGIKDKTIRNDIKPEVLAQTLWSQTTGMLQLLANKKDILHLYNVKETDLIECHYKIITNGLKMPSNV